MHKTDISFFYILHTCNRKLRYRVPASFRVKCYILFILGESEVKIYILKSKAQGVCLEMLSQYPKIVSFFLKFFMEFDYYQENIFEIKYLWLWYTLLLSMLNKE